MSRKFRYSEKVIRESLKSSEDLCKKGLLALWQYSVHNPEYNDEQKEVMDWFTTEIRPSEKELLLSLAKQLMEKGYLTENQTKAVRNRVPKYFSQLTVLANRHRKLPPIPVPDSDSILAEGRVVYWFRTEAGISGMFNQPDIFDSKNKTSRKVRIPVSENESLSLWFPKKCTQVFQAEDGIRYIGLPKWLCEKNNIPLDLAEPKIPNGMEGETQE